MLRVTHPFPPPEVTLPPTQRAVNNPEGTFQFQTALFKLESPYFYAERQGSEGAKGDLGRRWSTGTLTR
jgi:hypothetical protein